MKDSIYNKIINFIKRNISFIILLVGIVGFLTITNEVFNKELLTIDVVGHDLMSKYLICDFVTPIAKVVTGFGGVSCLIGLSLLSIVLIKNNKIGLSIIVNLGVVGVLNLLLKNILQRPRPLEYRMINVTGYSFPSGHSMVSMAFYGFIIYLIYKYVKNKKLKWLLMIVIGILVICIGISRIYLGVHYTSDVLAGFLFSVSYLMLYTSMVEKYLFNRSGGNDDEKKDY